MTSPNVEEIVDAVLAALINRSAGDSAGDVSGIMPNVAQAPWALRPATVVGSGSGAVLGTFDGDGLLGGSSTPVPLISLAGYLRDGERVMVLCTPPSGNFVVSRMGSEYRNLPVSAVSLAAGTGLTNSAAYSDYPGSVTLSLTKIYDATDLIVTFSPGWFTATANTGPNFGVSVNGTDQKVGHQGGSNVTNAHQMWTGTTRVLGSSVGAGPVTIVGRWARHSGTGSVNTDVTADWVTLVAQEVPPQ